MSMISRAGIALLICFAMAAAANAQSLPAGCASLVSELVEAREKGLLAVQIKQVMRVDHAANCFAEELQIPLRLNGTFHDLAALLSPARKSSNKQAGSTPNTGGTTSAVSEPFTLLSVASEYGGITTSSNNGTFTIQTALDQLPATLAEANLIATCNPDTSKPDSKPGCRNKWLNALHRFSPAITVDTSSSSKTVSATATGGGTTQPVSLQTNGSSAPSISAFSTKFVALNSQADGTSAWAKAVAQDTDLTHMAQKLSRALTSLPTSLDSNFYYLKWQVCTQRALAAAPAGGDFRPVIGQYYSQLYSVLVAGAGYKCYDEPRADAEIEKAVAAMGVSKPAVPAPQPGLVEAINNIRNAVQAYAAAVETLRRQVPSPVLALEYDLKSPQGQPGNSVFRAIASKTKLDSSGDNTKWTLTLNAAAEIYNSQPAASIPNAGRLRDVQAGAEIDFTLPSIPVLGQTTLGPAYYFQDQRSPAILNVTAASPIPGITFIGLPSGATQVFTKAGNIHVAQLKWGFGAGKNVKFPIAFSYSNRTELIAKPDWRGEFGIAYDFSGLSTAP